jgi:hypothetical protein
MLWVCPYILLPLLGNDSVNIFLHQRRIVWGVVFYALLVVAIESRRLVLLRTCFILTCLLDFDSVGSTLLPVFILELFIYTILEHKFSILNHLTKSGCTYSILDYRPAHNTCKIVMWKSKLFHTGTWWENIPRRKNITWGCLRFMWHFLMYGVTLLAILCTLLLRF